MTRPSYLNEFDYKGVELILDQGVEMVHDQTMEVRQNLFGLWLPDRDLIKIAPQRVRMLENLVILHEWLHAFEDIVLEKEHTEGQIDWWAGWCYRRDPQLVGYIRSYFKKEGF